MRCLAEHFNNADDQPTKIADFDCGFLNKGATATWHYHFTAVAFQWFNRYRAPGCFWFVFFFCYLNIAHMTLKRNIRSRMDFLWPVLWNHADQQVQIDPQCQIMECWNVAKVYLWWRTEPFYVCQRRPSMHGLRLSRSNWLIYRIPLQQQCGIQSCFAT